MHILIHNGLLYDGTGATPRSADIYIDDGIIRATGKNLNVPPEAAIIDASGLAVTPGFIDIHRHCDIACLIDEGFGGTELAQGITTAVMGNCGIAPIPAPKDPVWREEQFRSIEPVVGAVPDGLPLNSYRDYAHALSERSFPLNLGFFAGAGALKIAVRGFAPGPFSVVEMQKAQSLLEEAMQVGALGLSFGVMYRPECYSTAEEMADLVRAAAKYGGMLTAHIRGEGDSLVPSVSEMIDVAEMAGMPLNISHFKATGIQNWHSTIFRAIDVIENARARGIPVTADFYPYDGGSTTILSLLPPSVLENTQAELAAKLSTKEGVDLLRREVGKRHERWDNMALSIGWDRIIISAPVCAANEDCRGKSMKAAAEIRGLADEAELLARLICEEDGRTGIIVLSMAEADIDTVAALPWTCLISDSLYSGGSSPHPRLNGSFPKALRVFVREKKLLSMETAIAKMTGMPAARTGIKNRGLLKEGYAADVLVFDPARFTDHADYTHPAEQATGMEYVLVNGKPASGGGRSGSFITRDGAA